MFFISVSLVTFQRKKISKNDFQKIQSTFTKTSLSLEDPSTSYTQHREHVHKNNFHIIVKPIYFSLRSGSKNKNEGETKEG